VALGQSRASNLAYESLRERILDLRISHADLLAALEAKDSDKAEKAMRGHLAASLQPLHPAF
jgi:DNA-binding FadR family transcriptional regulator